MELDVKNQTSPRSTSVPVPGLADCSLSGGVKSTPEAGTSSPPSQSQVKDFDITVSNLPEKLGFPHEFQEELKSVGGSIHSLAEKLLNSFNLDDTGSFKVGCFVVLLSN